jgi:phospholipase C
MRTLVTATALALCTSGLLPGAVDRADAAAGSDSTPVTTTPIQHLVVVFQENASFDHYFGTYPQAANPPGDPPFTARTDTPTVNNLLPSPLNGNRDLRVTNPNAAKPFRLDRSQFVTCSQSHTYRPEERAANLGRMDRFVQATDNSGCPLPRPVPSPQVMGYFDGNTVTALWNYAQHYALEDNSFGTTYGPSTPGALNLVAGRTSGASSNTNDDKVVTEGTVFGDPDPLVDDCADLPERASLSGPNIGDLLSEAGVSWGWFQGGFRRSNSPDDETAVCETGHPNLGGKDEVDYEAHHDPFQYFDSTANPHHLPPSSPTAIGHDDQARHQYDLADFWTAAGNGDLPAVSFLKAAGYQDGHPGWGNSNPLDEQDFLVDTLNRLQRLPEWSDTAVVLLWDDSDGQYDHQFPPNVHFSGNIANDTLYGVGKAENPRALMCMAPPGQPAPPDDRIFEMRCGYGERLPLLVVSPFAKDNYVDHTLVDQTSVLRFIEDNWSLPRLGHGSFDAEAGSLLGMFDFAQPRDDVLILNHLTGNPNRPPTVDHVSLTPDPPRTDDTLTATADVADADQDPTNARQEQLRTSYAWFDGDRLLDRTGPTLDLSIPGHGDRGDTITVRVSAYDGIDTTVATSRVVIGDSAPAVSFSQQEAGVVYSDPLAPIAVTTSDPDGDEVSVAATGLPAGLAVTRGQDGAYRIGGTADDPAGGYDAVVTASDGTLTTQTPLRITVGQESATLGYTGDLLAPTGSPTGTGAEVHLRAHLVQEDDGTPGDLGRADVVFDLYAPGSADGPPAATYRASAGADGDASVTVPALRTGTWSVVARTEPGSGSFAAPASDPVPVTVYAPDPGGLVAGAGWVPDGGVRGTFAVTARTGSDGGARGQSWYAFPGPGGGEVVVRSTTWLGGGLAVAEDRATIAGRATVTVLDNRGRVVRVIDDARFRVDAVDAAARRTPDGYALSVYTPDGQLFHHVGSAVAPELLGGGRIVVQP